MSYALLWIESLAVSLLLVATVLAWTSRLRSRPLARILFGLMFLLPLGTLGALAAVTAFLKFASELDVNWFGYAGSLFGAFLAGTVMILWIGSRRPEASPESFASAWHPGRLSLGLLTAFAIATMTLWNMALEVRAQGNAFRNEAGALMLAVSPPTVRDSQNAGLIYEKAFARLEADASLKDSESPLGNIETAMASPTKDSLLKRHELTLKLLRQAATLPDCRFEHDYARPSFTMLLPELSQARTAARLLHLHAMNEIAAGRVDSAVTDINTMYHLSRAIAEEPIVISLLVSISIHAEATRLLPDVLSAVTQKDSLARLNVGDASFDSRWLIRSRQGEEAFGLSMFADVAEGRMTFGDLTGLVNAQESHSATAMSAFQPVSTLFQVFFLADDVAAYRQLMAGQQLAGKGPYPRPPPPPETASAFRRRGVLTSVIAPALKRSTETCVRAQATHLTATVAVAMTRYRLDHNTFPETLDALAPDYLDEVPADPFTGKPLRLVKKDADWIVYSVGPDARDDGGAPYDSKAETGDLIFKLTLPKAAAEAPAKPR